MEATAKLGRPTGTEAYRRWLSRGEDTPEQAIAAALYQHLSEHYHPHYLLPETTPCFQTIRPAHRMFPEPAGRQAQGTCLEWVVLFAGCLENVGCCPLIVLLTDAQGVPRHALCGCWTGPVPGCRPIISDPGVLQREMDAGHLFLLECTGFARGAGPRRDFQAACAYAARQLAASASACAVDLGALRPPLGHITPMEFPYEPDVGRADEAARAFARAKRREAVEMVCLLYGVIAARGPILLAILAKRGRDPSTLHRQLDDLVLPGECSQLPVPTRNYQHAFWLAGQIAWQQGVPSVREQDLLWALLVKTDESSGLRRAFEHLNLDPECVRAELSGHRPAPRMPTSLSSFSISARVSPRPGEVPS
jgi:hypothetical protein